MLAVTIKTSVLTIEILNILGIAVLPALSDVTVWFIFCDNSSLDVRRGLRNTCGCWLE
jgi:hypothetical protein